MYFEVNLEYSSATCVFLSESVILLWYPSGIGA